MVSERGVTGSDHFFSVSGGGAEPIALPGCSAKVCVIVSEESAWSESGDNEVGCKTF